MHVTCSCVDLRLYIGAGEDRNDFVEDDIAITLFEVVMDDCVVNQQG